MAPGFPNPGTMFEIQFIEFTVKVLWGFPGSFSLWKLLCWQFGGWCLVCWGEVESGPALMESSSAWVTGEEQAGGPSRPVRLLEWTAVLQPGPEWAPTCFLRVHPLGVPNIFSEEAVLKAISVIKAVFIIFRVFEKHEMPAHSPKRSQLHKHGFADDKQQEHTGTGHIWIQSLAWSATSFPVPASLSGFSSTLLDSHFTPSSLLGSRSDPGTPDFMWRRAGVWARDL